MVHPLHDVGVSPLVVDTPWEPSLSGD